MSAPRFPHPGHHTAYGGMLDYRLDKVARAGVLHGDWLDLGCADGYYSVGLAERGATSVVGAEVNADLVQRANELPHPESVRFVLAGDGKLPFEDASFDGVLLNEVLEHVADERAVFSEIVRVLRPRGTLALFSPNRFFPFEGHGARWSETRALWSRPVPLMPWLPRRLTHRVAAARNYWPWELERLATDAGMTVRHRDWALAQFEQYPWLPQRATAWYQRNLERIERSPAARFLAVSTFVLAQSGEAGAAPSATAETEPSG